jgi:hypothetical protein
MSMEESVEWDLVGKTEVLGENLAPATLSTTNPTWPDLDSNLGSRNRKPATNSLSYGIAENWSNSKEKRSCSETDIHSRG